MDGSFCEISPDYFASYRSSCEERPLIVRACANYNFEMSKEWGKKLI